jgi:hypothetical protein
MAINSSFSRYVKVLLCGIVLVFYLTCHENPSLSSLGMKWHPIRGVMQARQRLINAEKKKFTK